MFLASAKLALVNILKATLWEGPNRSTSIGGDDITLHGGTELPAIMEGRVDNHSTVL